MSVEGMSYVPEEAKNDQAENEKVLNKADDVMSVRQGRPDVNAHHDQMARYGMAQMLGRENEFRSEKPAEDQTDEDLSGHGMEDSGRQAA